MKTILALALIGLALGACKKEKDKKLNFTSKLRSTGKVENSLVLQHLPAGAALLETQTANSVVDLEYFKVPIRRINLTAGASGTGYTESSPAFYTCDATDESDCAVNLLDDSIDSLLTAGTASGSVTFKDTKTYTGVSVEHCGDHAEGDVYHALVKGSVVLGTTTYYTNSSSGLSTTGPAEEVAIPMNCSGSNSTLTEPITVTPDSSVDLVFYADPSANIFATDDKALANSNCVGSTEAICSNNIMIFGTVDSAKPTVERYLLDTGATYSKVLVTMLFNQSDNAFGVLMSEYFDNTAKDKLLHTPTMAFSKVSENADGSYNFLYYVSDTEDGKAVSNFQRADHSGTLDAFVDTPPVAYTATKL